MKISRTQFKTSHLVSKTFRYQAISNRLRHDTPWISACLFIMMWAIFLSWISVVRHQRFLSNIGDLGYFENILWHTTHGDFFGSSVYSVNYLGLHFAPALLLFVAGYGLVPITETLLIMQAAVVSSGSLIVYWLIFAVTHSSKIAWLSMAISLVNPYTLFVSLIDFHQDVLAIPFMYLCYSALYIRRFSLFISGLIALTFTREDYALIVIGFGFYLIFMKKPVMGFELIIFGIIYIISIIYVIIPYVLGQPYAYGELNPSLGHGSMPGSV